MRGYFDKTALSADLTRWDQTGFAHVIPHEKTDDLAVI